MAYHMIPQLWRKLLFGKDHMCRKMILMINDLEGHRREVASLEVGQGGRRSIFPGLFTGMEAVRCMLGQS